MYQIQQGQIAHLDKNPTNNDPDNLAFLCLKHHDQYDSVTSQSKGLTPQEVKEYRNLLYMFIKQAREQDLYAPQIQGEKLSPLLEETRRLPNLSQTALTSNEGIQLIAPHKPGSIRQAAVLTIFSRSSMYFAQHPLVQLPVEKWLMFQAVYANGTGLKLQVQGKKANQIEAFCNALRRINPYAVLEGKRTSATREFVTLSRVLDEDCLFLNLHFVLENYSTIDASFYLTFPVADQLVSYLDKVGFSRTPEDVKGKNE